MSNKPFSQELGEWLSSGKPKTLQNLTAVFAEKSFAIVILVLMFLPALPLPTGGVVHIFELIVMLVALEMIIGQKTVWLPKKWMRMRLGERTLNKALPFIMRRLRWFEKYSKPRMEQVVASRNFVRLAGIFVLCFALTAFVAPPFSGLDTVPALGAVIIALALILEDLALFIFGCAVGVSGIGLVVGLSAAITTGVQKLL